MYVGVAFQVWLAPREEGKLGWGFEAIASLEALPQKHVGCCVELAVYLMAVAQCLLAPPLRKLLQGSCQVERGDVVVEVYHDGRAGGMGALGGLGGLGALGGLG